VARSLLEDYGVREQGGRLKIEKSPDIGAAVALKEPHKTSDRLREGEGTAGQKRNRTDLAGVAEGIFQKENAKN